MRRHPPTTPPPAAAFTTLLIDEHIVKPAQLPDLETYAQAHDGALVDALVSRGVLTEEAAYGLLARACHLALVPLRDVAASEMALKLVPVTLARRHLIAPLASDAYTLTYATCQPFDATAEANVTLSTGRRVTRCLATRSDLTAAVARLYPEGKALERRTGAATRKPARSLTEGGVTAVQEVNGVPAGDDIRTSTQVGVPAAGPAMQSVLIADDEPIARMALRLLLEKAHYTVFEAADGSQAAAVAQREQPSLAVIDINLGRIDGVRIIERIRAGSGQRAMPIIVLAGAAGMDVERQVLDMGADDYMVKPFDAAVLLARVNAAFRRRRLSAA